MMPEEQEVWNHALRTVREGAAQVPQKSEQQTRQAEQEQQEQRQQQQKNIPRPANKDEFDKLKPGTQFYDPYGTLRIK